MLHTHTYTGQTIFYASSSTFFLYFVFASLSFVLLFKFGIEKFCVNATEIEQTGDRLSARSTALDSVKASHKLDEMYATT